MNDIVSLEVESKFHYFKAGFLMIATIATKNKSSAIVAILPSTVAALDFSCISAIAAIVVITRKPVNVKAGFHDL